VGEADRRARITGCKLRRSSGTELNVSVLVNPASNDAHTPSTLASSPANCTRGDKDVTLHPVMALLVGAITLHATRSHEFSESKAYAPLGSYKDRNVEGKIALSRISR